MTTPHETRLTITAPIHLTRTGQKSPLWMSSNDREHWAKRAKHTKQWRTLARMRGHGCRQVPDGCVATVHMLVDRGHNRRADSGNLAPTFKAILDGLVDAGIFVDDDDSHVVGPVPGRKESNRLSVPHVEVVIRWEE